MTHYRVLRQVNDASCWKSSLKRAAPTKFGTSIIPESSNLGDPLYATDGKQRLLLHSWKMGLLLPFTFEPIEIEANEPDDFKLFERQTK